MHFDPNNTTVQRCAKGMELEATQPEEAKALLQKVVNNNEEESKEAEEWLKKFN